MFSRPLTVVLLMVFALAANATPACGPSIDRQEEINKCMQQCNLELMNCLDAESCLAPDGQLIPCESICNDNKAACEESCASY